jgi:hypothetical protein
VCRRQYYVGLSTYTFARRRNRLTTHFSERIPVAKRRIYVLSNIIFPPKKHRSSNSSFGFRYSDQNSVCIYYLFRASYVIRTSLTLWFEVYETVAFLSSKFEDYELTECEGKKYRWHLRQTAGFIFGSASFPEKGSRKFLRNVGTYVQSYTASHLGRPW